MNRPISRAAGTADALHTSNSCLSRAIPPESEWTLARSASHFIYIYSMCENSTTCR